MGPTIGVLLFRDLDQALPKTTEVYWAGFFFWAG